MTAGLEFDGVLDVKRVSALTAQVRSSLDGDGPIEVDATKVTGIDTAGAQVLVALSRSAGARARWSLSPELEHALAGLGLSASHFSKRNP